MTVALRGTGYFGKVPIAGDFQRMLLAEGPDAKTLDWFNDGWTRHALAGRRPDLTVPISFCWQRPGSSTALIGSMVASRDRAGRRFPLLVFGAVAGVERTADVLSSAHEFFARATSVAESGRAGLDLQALRAHVESLRSGIDPEGIARQAAWQAEITAAAWAEGSAGGTVERLRCLDFAFSSGGRPNFVLRGRWHGDLRHFAAGVAILQRLGQQAPAMLFWDQQDGVVSWRVAYEYGVPSLFEGLLWHDTQTAAAFDTEPGVVVVPATFVGRESPAADARLAALLQAP